MNRRLLIWALVLWSAFGPARAGAAPPAAWTYDVKADAGAKVLEVDAWFEGGRSHEISVTTGAEPYVEEVRLLTAAGAKPLTPRNGSWFTPKDQGQVHVHYRFRLMDAARHLDGKNASVSDGIAIAAPGVYLLHPLREPDNGTYQLKVRTAAADHFICGLARNPAGDGYESGIGGISEGETTAIGPMDVQEMTSGGGALRLGTSAGLPLGHAAVADWIKRKADAVSKFYGRFPVHTVMIVVTTRKGDKVSGRAEGGGGTALILSIGSGITATKLLSDWTITHEMVHLAFPSVNYHHHWIEEGLATYLEPIIRARVGDLPATKVWHDLARDLPQGQPEKGDRGLDHTHTWGRTYWGGALFCFVADMQIRRETSGKRSLDDAVRGILDAGGNLTKDWPLERALAAGDRATGTQVLEKLYAAWKATPVTVDLANWWRLLGVSLDGHTVRLDDHAPLAAIRRAVTAPSLTAAEFWSAAVEAAENLKIPSGKKPTPAP